MEAEKRAEMQPRVDRVCRTEEKKEAEADRTKTEDKSRKVEEEEKEGVQQQKLQCSACRGHGSVIGWTSHAARMFRDPPRMIACPQCCGGGGIRHSALQPQ